MARVTVVQVVYNSRRFMDRVWPAVFTQSFNDVRHVAVVCGNDDGGRGYLETHFPGVEVVDFGGNVGFAVAHNKIFARRESDLYMLVNPDLIMERDYIEKLVAAFDADPKLGAATGKLLQFDFGSGKPTGRLDSTGVTIGASGRARDRGQHEADTGQYDRATTVAAVSAAGAMVRAGALEAVKEPKRGGGAEYLDESFHSYWEDVDLFWRMSNAGWRCAYVPEAVAYHGRGAGSSPGGYRKLFSFIRHHRAVPARVRELNYRNHIATYLKNARWFHPLFFLREILMLCYIAVFEPGTLRAVPVLLRQLPDIFRKRRFVQSLHARAA